MHPRVKICCIKSPEEATLAISCGATAIGLVSAMPSGPGVISEVNDREDRRSCATIIGHIPANLRAVP